MLHLSLSFRKISKKEDFRKSFWIIQSTFLLMAKRKCHRKSLFENRLAFKNKTPEKELQTKLERNDHTDELASFQKLAAMQNRKWKSKGPWVRNLANSLSKNRIYACSVCSSVLLSFSAGLGRRIDLVLFGTQRLQQQKHLHSSNLATASCGGLVSVTVELFSP